MGQAQTRGNFSSTCTNLKLNAVDFAETATLTADCQEEDQSDPKNAIHGDLTYIGWEKVMFDTDPRLSGGTG